MSFNWKEVRLGDVASIRRGSSPRPIINFMAENGMPWVKIADATESNSRFIHKTNEFIKEEGVCKSVIVNEGDLILSNSGTAGLPKFMGITACIHDGWQVFKNLEGIDKNFLFYTLLNIRSFLLHNAYDSTMKNLTLDMVRDAKVNLPPLPTQKKIAHILSTLDDKIELNRKMNQTLEDMAQTIFKSWFVDFDPVHAKANCESEAELENIAKELGISKEILDLFPNEFIESEMWMIPKGWEAIKIGKVLKRYQAPKRYKKEAIKNFGKTVVLEQGVNIILGYHDDEAEFQATEDEPMFIFGDHTCVMKLSTKPFSISENVIPLSGLIRNGYWTYYATYGQQTFQEYRRHWSELIVKEIVMAEEKLCDLFAKQIKPLILKIEQNILENNELIKTRDTLLPKLLSGEIDVDVLGINHEQ